MGRRSTRHHRATRRCRDESDVLRILEHGQADILALPRDDQARVLLHLQSWLGMLEGKDRAPPSVGHAGVDALSQGVGLARINRREREHLRLLKGLDRQVMEPEAIQPALSHYIEDYLSEKQRSTRTEEGVTANTAYQARLTMRLWEEAMGPIPVAQVGRKEAAKFKDLLLKLPSSHGKSSVRRTLMEAVDAADAKQEAGQVIERMAMKTCKRHFSSMQQAWKWLLERGEVNANPFAGFSFSGAQSSPDDRNKWSDDDLLSLLQSPYMQKVAAARARDWWLVSIAMWAGMRVEEACRLRPVADVEEQDGVPLLLVEAQGAPLPEWSPKTQSGARAVPVHHLLMEAGLLDLARERVTSVNVVEFAV